MILLFCVINQTTDQAISLNYYYWAVTTIVPTKLQVVCLTSSYYIKLKCPVDIIFLHDALKDTLIPSTFQLEIDLVMK